MNVFLLIRKSEELGINFWLRLIAIALSLSLIFLATYYFLFVNRDPQKQDLPTITAVRPDTEKRNADAALAAVVKSALAQTMRLQNYSIGVEYKDGVITLIGEVASHIDRDFATDVARQAVGDKVINNQIQVLADRHPTLQPGETKAPQLNVEDLEIEADVREILHRTNDPKIQAIKIQVHDRNVNLSGTIDSTQQKTRVEQLVRSIPKVSTVDNQIRIGN